MATLCINIDDRAMRVLERLSVVTGKPIDRIAAEAVEAEAITHLPGGLPNMRFAPETVPLDLGGTVIGMTELDNGRIAFGGYLSDPVDMSDPYQAYPHRWPGLARMAGVGRP